MRTIDKIERLLIEHEIPSHKRAGLLSRITGKSVQGIYKWFKGKTAKPDYDNVKAIADHFNIDIGTLWDESEELADRTPKAEKIAKLNQLLQECLDLGIEDELAENAETMLKIARRQK